MNLFRKIVVFLCAGYSRSGRQSKQEPDTIVLKGVPSRWFAEPRVSSKPSLLVTHTIFSTFGRIRHVNVFAADCSFYFKMLNPSLWFAFSSVFIRFFNLFKSLFERIT